MSTPLTWSDPVSTLVHEYSPYGAAATLLRTKDPEVLLSGPAGTGKSRACLEKVAAMMLAVPRARALLVRKTLVSLASTGLVTWREHVVPELLAAGAVTYYGGSSVEPPAYRFANGSVVLVGGMDKATKIMSSEFDVIFAQEAIELTETDWEHLTTRLRNGRISYQQIIGDTNPDRPSHWLRRRCDENRTTLIECRHEDNPRLVDQATGQYTPEGAVYLERLDRLTGVRHARLRRGLWVAAEGLVYDEWDPTVHLIAPRPIPADWTRVWAIDFGYLHPFVLQRWAVDPDGRMILYAEHYRTGWTIDQHAAAILAQVTDPTTGRWTEPRPSAIVCDHDAESRARLQKLLGQATVAADKRVLEGIQVVQQALRSPGPAAHSDHQARPMILLHRDAVRDRDQSLADAGRPCSTAEEIVGYIWDDPTKKEAPVKLMDDGCDALRYAVMHVHAGHGLMIRELW